MKTRMFIFLAGMLLIPAITQAQKDPVDRVFEKYAGKEGYTTVYITSKMFSLFSEANVNDPEFNDLVNSLKSIRILASDDSGTLDPSVNFYDEIMKDLPVDEYEELMVVQDKNQKLKFLVKEKDGRIAELLLVVGGGGDNALIDIRGNIDLKKVAEISKMINVQGLDELEKIDEKKK
ncbi:MAG: DUF4252 domain-containing protein [Chlorobi bacterium]|nr:DUF4252 domain-containing protein [Chlorobiota bacterium]